MNVAAIIVTRGDQDLTTVLASLPEEWEQIVWDNGAWNVEDLAVYGRYAAIANTDAELIYVQDDDCVVSDPQAIVNTHPLMLKAWMPEDHPGHPHDALDGAVVCNMPPEFRHEFYEDHALVGFGACFHRDAPRRAFDGFFDTYPHFATQGSPDGMNFARTCDVVFTALTPRVLVDVPKENLPWAYHYDRMWRQPEHQAERVRMLDLVREIR